MKLYKIIGTILILSATQAAIYGQSLIKPIQYPLGTIGNSQPYLIWQDLLNTPDWNDSKKYRITIHPENNRAKALSYTINPEVIYKSFLVFRIPQSLPDNKYQYSIERLVDDKSVDTKYYYYLKYPITSFFTLDSSSRSEIDNLKPGNLIKYMYLEKNNRLTNYYNFIFFTASSSATLGIGLLFYSMSALQFGLITKIIYVICFASAATGFSASGYYGYKYLQKKSELAEILKTGKRVSIMGGVRSGKFCAAVKYAF